MDNNNNKDRDESLRGRVAKVKETQNNNKGEGVCALGGEWFVFDNLCGANSIMFYFHQVREEKRQKKERRKRMKHRSGMKSLFAKTFFIFVFLRNNTTVFSLLQLHYTAVVLVDADKAHISPWLTARQGTEDDRLTDDSVDRFIQDRANSICITN